jgi:hypothetical protein
MRHSILDTHPVFDTWDPRQALRTLARGLSRGRHGPARWFVIWPAVLPSARR